MQSLGKNIAVQELTQRPELKTRAWFVYNSQKEILGKISWERASRQYAFVPTPRTIFSAGCLDDIAAFTRRQTAQHRKAVKNVRDMALQQCG